MAKMSAAKKKKMWKIAGWTAFGLSAVMVARESYLVFGTNRETRRKLYEAALKRANELGKPLVVIGDPDGGILHHTLGRDYQCGMICIDPKGCGECGSTKEIVDDPTHALSQMGAGSAVVFDSGLFAYADDGFAMAQQLLRVSGGAGNLFMFDVPRFTLTSMFEPKRKRVLKSAPPSSMVLDWKNGLLSAEPSTGQREGSVKLGGVRALGHATGRSLGYTPSPNMYYYERLVQRYPTPRGRSFSF